MESLEIKDDFFRSASGLCLLVARSADNNPVEQTPQKEESRKRSSRGGRKWLKVVN